MLTLFFIKKFTVKILIIKNLSMPTGTILINIIKAVVYPSGL